jgi:hypothetical protein
VYQAVLPLKKLAQDKAEEHIRAQIEVARKNITKTNDIEVLVPALGDKPSEYAQRQYFEARQFYFSLCSLSKHRYLTINEEQVQGVIDRTIRDAGLQFDAFVYKLNEKINDVTLSAELSGDPWNYSTLVVETKNKGRQVWTTKIIVNVSKYGKLFNQWPTRKVS